MWPPRWLRFAIGSVAASPGGLRHLDAARGRARRGEGVMATASGKALASWFGICPGSTRIVQQDGVPGGRASAPGLFRIDDTKGPPW
jgi:hypothetical protein